MANFSVSRQCQNVEVNTEALRQGIVNREKQKTDSLVLHADLLSSTGIRKVVLEATQNYL